MWTETTFDLTRQEIRTTHRFDEVVAAIEARALVVVPEANHELLGGVPLMPYVLVSSTVRDCGAVSRTG
jgi:hypothetical protein